MVQTNSLQKNISCGSGKCTGRGHFFTTGTNNGIRERRGEGRDNYGGNKVNQSHRDKIIGRHGDTPREHRLPIVDEFGREGGGAMLSLTGMMRFYFVPGVTDMRCGYFRLSEIVKNQLHRNPYNGDVFIFMSKDRKKVKLIRFENNAYFLYEKCYVNGYSFMKVSLEEDNEPTYKIEWKYLVALLECPIKKVLKLR